MKTSRPRGMWRKSFSTLENSTLPHWQFSWIFFFGDFSILRISRFVFVLEGFTLIAPSFNGKCSGQFGHFGKWWPVARVQVPIKFYFHGNLKVVKIAQNGRRFLTANLVNSISTNAFELWWWNLAHSLVLESSTFPPNFTAIGRQTFKRDANNHLARHWVRRCRLIQINFKKKWNSIQFVNKWWSIEK